MKLGDVPYLSPVVRFDPVAQDVIIQRIDPHTGEVSEQFPDAEIVKHDRVAALAAHPAPAAPSTHAVAVLAQSIASTETGSPPAPTRDAPPTRSAASGQTGSAARVSLIV